MRSSLGKKTLIRFLLYVPLIIIFTGIIWYKWQERRHKVAIARIVKTASLPDSTTFRDYAVFLHQQIKPDSKVDDVHKIIRGYSRIDTVRQWPNYLEIYRYDMPLIARVFRDPTQVIIEYDSTWTFKSFAFED